MATNEEVITKLNAIAKLVGEQSAKIDMATTYVTDMAATSGKEEALRLLREGGPEDLRQAKKAIEAAEWDRMTTSQKAASVALKYGVPALACIGAGALVGGAIGLVRRGDTAVLDEGGLRVISGGQG